MRRKEFNLTEQYEQDVKAFLDEMKYGCLALNNVDGYPVIVPLNYIYLNKAIYLHGSKSGEKMDMLKTQDKASFIVTQDYALIPSYLEDPYFACPASTLYKSVIMNGPIKEVVDEREKHEVLDALMRKLQPEGGYAPIIYEDESYRKRVKATAVLKLEVETLSPKFKFGQNWKDDKREKVVAHLTERNNELDAETIKLMERYCPYHKQKEND